MRRHPIAARGIMVILSILLLTGCVPDSFAATAFQRTIGDGVALLSASALAIEQVHTGRLDTRYARSSLAQYRTHLEQLPSLDGLDGAPDRATTERLTALLDQTSPILASPCLASDCDWQSQVQTLRQASQALDEAGK